MKITPFLIFAILGVSQPLENYPQLVDHTQRLLNITSNPVVILTQGNLNSDTDTLWLEKQIYSSASLFDYEELFSAPTGRTISYVEVKNKLRNHVSASISGGSEHSYVVLRLRRMSKEPIKCDVRMYLKPKVAISIFPQSSVILTQGHLNNYTDKLYYDKPVRSIASPLNYVFSIAVPDGYKISFVEVINKLGNQISVSILGGSQHSYVSLEFKRKSKEEIKCQVRIFHRLEYTEKPVYSPQKMWTYGKRDNYTEELAFDRGIYLLSWAILYHSEIFHAQAGQKISCIEVKGANATLVPGTGPGYSEAQLIFKSQKPNKTISGEIKIYVKSVDWPEATLIFSQGKRDVLHDRWEFSKEFSANWTTSGFNKTIHAPQERTINYLRVTNKSQSHVNVAVVSGGPGQSYVTLKFTSESNEPIRCQVRIYTVQFLNKTKSDSNLIRNNHFFLCLLLIFVLSCRKI